ncbi:MAG: hypothetical protein GXY83_22525 [Rhodopirellula sp.]|nr:hypothetical protein [Rhodopirellula sp.]
MTYLNDLVTCLWQYRKAAFAGQDALFDRCQREGHRPPVFNWRDAIHNVLLAPSLSDLQQSAVRGMLPASRRHRWFQSMRSSQALAQTVFGNLAVSGSLACLSHVTSDCGNYPFAGLDAENPAVELEYQVDHLGEDPRRCTSIDVVLRGKRHVYVECKLAEDGVGGCSRPRLADQDPDHCNGNYEHQMGRQVRCALTARGIGYWQYIPGLFGWNDIDQVPCPIRCSYQLVRTVLAACVRADGRIQTEGRSVVLLVDKRNPAFQRDGDGRRAFDAVHAALRNPEILHWCTWQDVVQAMRQKAGLIGFADEVHDKYGF